MLLSIYRIYLFMTAQTISDEEGRLLLSSLRASWQAGGTLGSGGDGRRHGGQSRPAQVRDCLQGSSFSSYCTHNTRWRENERRREKEWDADTRARVNADIAYTCLCAHTCVFVCTYGHAVLTFGVIHMHTHANAHLLTLSLSHTHSLTHTHHANMPSHSDTYS